MLWRRELEVRGTRCRLLPHDVGGGRVGRGAGGRIHCRWRCRGAGAQGLGAVWCSTGGARKRETRAVVSMVAEGRGEGAHEGVA
jgi:hypothetical protein